MEKGTILLFKNLISFEAVLKAWRDLRLGLKYKVFRNRSRIEQDNGKVSALTPEEWMVVNAFGLDLIEDRRSKSFDQYTATVKIQSIIL